MTEPNNVTPQNPPPPQACVSPPAFPAARTPWAVGKNERRLLPLALVLGYMGVSFLLDWMDGQWMHLPGFGITALTAGWYLVLFLYRGATGLEKRINQVLLGAIGLLGLTFTLFSNHWFRFWNCGALFLLVAVHTWELCGGTRLCWNSAGMLFERLWLMVKGPFVRCGALLDTVKSAGKMPNMTRSLPALIGISLTLPVLWLVSTVLMDADAFFALVAGSALEKMDNWFGALFLRLILAVCILPFVFSLLYFAAHTEQKKLEVRSRMQWDSLPAVILLTALNGLYLFFLAVQSAALFGGRAYLAQAGISFAEYARSGFFQLVGLAGLNVAVVLAAVWLCRESRCLRILSTVLVVLTAVLLVSACWRMTLYVSAYGLSFKRLLTYWGMGMLAILLTLTIQKIWRQGFRFFQAAAPIALAGWLVLNYCNIDAIAVRYNAAQVSAGRLAQSAVDDLLYSGFSYDGLVCLDGAEGDFLQWLRSEAGDDCRSWTTWSVSAWMAAKG